MDGQKEELTRIAETLDELLALKRMETMDQARSALQRALPGDSHRLIYQASTGGSSREVAEIAHVSDKAVRDNWKRFFRAGLMREDRQTKGRFVRTFDLEDFDMLPAGATPAPEAGVAVSEAGAAKGKKAKPLMPGETPPAAGSKPRIKKATENADVTLTPAQP